MDGIVSKLNIAKMAMGKPRDPVFPSPKFGAIDLKNPSLVKRTIFTKQINAKFNLIITSNGVTMTPGTQSSQKGIHLANRLTVNRKVREIRRQL